MGEALIPERRLFVENIHGLCFSFSLCLCLSQERHWPLSRDSCFLETFKDWPCPWVGHPLYFHKIPGFGEVNLGMITYTKSTIFWPDIIRSTFPVIIISALMYLPSLQNPTLGEKMHISLLSQLFANAYVHHQNNACVEQVAGSW